MKKSKQHIQTSTKNLVDKTTPNNTKPEGAPDEQETIVLFKSGATMRFRFYNSLSAQDFRSRFSDWIDNPNPPHNHRAETCFVNLWDNDAYKGTQQMITIDWETVAAINGSFRVDWPH